MSFPELSTPENQAPHQQAETFNRPDMKTTLKHLLLFVLTFICVTFTGILWVGQSAGIDQYTDMLPEGVLFATIFLLFLGSHEFGHYFAAIHHRVKVTLPYFIPIPAGIGTLGAVIRIKEKINETRKLFDIGIAGPIAGFVVSMVTLLYGFATLPGPEFIMNFSGHEDVIAYVNQFGAYPDNPAGGSEGMLMVLGNTLLYDFLAGFFDHVPPMWEMYHYPFLFAGWLGLFFTALNLMPVGQLDGGHILYSLIGFRKHRIVARFFFCFLTGLAGMEAIPFMHTSLMEWMPGLSSSMSITIWALVLLYLMKKAYHNEFQWVAPAWTASLLLSVTYVFMSGSGLEQTGSMIWVVWSFFLTYFVGLEHPPALYEQPLSPVRKVLGWCSMGIFILCISPNPIYFLN
ncbi:MAG: site-2 protease family protein [Balneolaceae bacterium]